jgi:hypothetical protein
MRPFVEANQALAELARESVAEGTEVFKAPETAKNAIVLPGSPFRAEGGGAPSNRD